MNMIDTKIKKFNWKQTIETNILLLRFGGLWPTGNDNYKRDLYLLQASIFLSLFLMSDIMTQVVKILYILNDLEAITGIIFVLLTKTLGIFKVYFFIKNLPQIKHLMVILDNDIFQPKSLRQIKMIQADLKSWILLFRALWSTSCSAIIFWGLFPLLDKSYKQYRLPFLAWYPFPTKSTPVYEVTYLYQIISIAYNAICNVNFDTLIAALNMYAGVQFDLLCDNLKNIKVKDNIKNVRDELLSCIEHHKLIIEFTKVSNKFSNWIIFFQFVTGGVTIALTMFQLTIVVPLSSEFYCLLFFEYAVLVQIFMYCWFGNELQLKSNNVTNAIAQSTWIDFPLPTQKQMLFFMLKCDKPIRVSALKLFYVSLETFVKILRTAWSYFALLHQLGS